MICHVDIFATVVQLLNLTLNLKNVSRSILLFDIHAKLIYSRLVYKYLEVVKNNLNKF